MPTDPVTHFVFVDFENVPNVDLDAIGAMPVVVTLLIGKNQTKLDTALVAQIHRHAAKVRLVEVGAAGRNALDLTLAYYLGRAVAEQAGAEWHIVSKDKDFEPLLAHLRGLKLKVARSESFAGLAFLPTPKPVSSPRKPAPAQKKPPAAGPEISGDKFAKLSSRLKNHAGPRPKRITSLLHHIDNAFGNKLTEPERQAIVDRLIAEEIVKIDVAGKVTYLDAPGISHGRERRASVRPITRPTAPAVSPIG